MTQQVGNGLVETVIAAGEARVNITVNGMNADMAQLVNRDASDADIRRWATEAVRTGSVPGIPADPTASFEDFVIDRYPPHEGRDHHMLALRPKVPFGAP